ncbi:MULTISPECIES: DUF1439 domain-containing protein [Pasteurellaceae]|uniref:DUF1439 domain-containing protein n=1 Tax=Rodentibacter genomosp. 1 TaxID=1908264 RepID=A0A1V3J8Z5_9PAST|nr:DUF1439 domain-containing protein [Rodentibacter genomosp. 1]MBF0751010.1 DUF1439 domain-containing protein [Pasteurella sp. 19428wF3_WM03]OOF51907.1 hypothetical protein BKK54_00780 [Rodentibacter genomosp. 1]TFU52365.1 DUF1439 domain-containing protein [Pasteurella sp. WM03]
MKNLTTCLTLLLGLSILSTTQASPFKISEDQVNQYLAEKSSIADKFSFPGLFSLDYQLKDLTTKIGRDIEKRVEINGTAEGLFKLGNKQFPAKLNLTFDTIPYYEPEKGAVYLRNLRILRWSGEPNEYMEQLQIAMPFLSESISALLSSIPIYTLDETNIRDVLIKKFAKGIKIEPGVLELETNIL